MIYRIYSIGPGPDRYFTRKRCDAAKLCAERLAYEIIEGYAGLDTAWGHKAMDAVKALDMHEGGAVWIQDHALSVEPSNA